MLPVLSIPTFELVLPSSGESIKFRPFLVKEEKILLQALEGGQEKEMIEAVRQIINNCVLTPVKVDSMPIFDLEYLFLQLRAKSVGEVIELQYKCQAMVRTAQDPESIDEEPGPEEMCGHLNKVQINVDDIKMQRDPLHNPVIMLTDTVGMKMQYPRIELMRKVSLLQRSRKGGIEGAIALIAQCVESIFENDQSYDTLELKDVEAFLETLTQGQFKKIQQFFDTMPQLRHQIHFRCQKCGYHEDMTLSGMESFFV